MKSCLKCHTPLKSETWVCHRCGWKPKITDGFTSFALKDAKSGSGFEPDCFPMLYAIEKKHFWFRARNRIIIWAFKRFFPTAETFLEIGCGTGFVLKAISHAMPRLRISGSELFPEGLIFAQKRVPSATLFQMDAVNIPFVDEFDILGAFDVLEHIADDRKVITELRTALRPDGRLILTIPQHPALWSNFDVKSCHVRRYTRKEILRKMSEAGFQKVFVSSFVTFLLPFMIVSRWKTKSDSDEQVPGEAAKIPATLNFLFELVLTFELLLIRLGLSFPFGGSLLVIARKK